MARDKEGFALATRTLAGINQRAGLIAMEYGKYDETPATSAGWRSSPSNWPRPTPTRSNR